MKKLGVEQLGFKKRAQKWLYKDQKYDLLLVILIDMATSRLQTLFNAVDIGLKL